MTKSQDMIMIGKQTLIIIKTIYKKNEIAERNCWKKQKQISMDCTV